MAGKKRNPLFDLFPSDEDEEEDEAAELAAANLRTKARPKGRFARARDDDDDDAPSVADDAQSTYSRYSMSTSVAGDDMGGGRTARFLDERFAKLLSAEYSDEEIGELDPDDPRVNGHEDIEARKEPARPPAPHAHAPSLPTCTRCFMPHAYGACAHTARA